VRRAAPRTHPANACDRRGLELTTRVQPATAQGERVARDPPAGVRECAQIATALSACIDREPAKSRDHAATSDAARVGVGASQADAITSAMTQRIPTAHT